MWIYTAVDFLGDLSHGNNHKIWGKMTGLEESSALASRFSCIMSVAAARVKRLDHNFLFP